MERIFDELRAWCSAKRGRQVELAKILGTSRQQVSHWLARRKDPSLSEWVRITHFLNAQKDQKPKKK